jgi:hypothetical protein
VCQSEADEDDEEDGKEGDDIASGTTEGAEEDREAERSSV